MKSRPNAHLHLLPPSAPSSSPPAWGWVSCDVPMMVVGSITYTAHCNIKWPLLYPFRQEEE